MSRLISRPSSADRLVLGVAVTAQTLSGVLVESGPAGPRLVRTLSQPLGVPAATSGHVGALTSDPDDRSTVIQIGEARSGSGDLFLASEFGALAAAPRAATRTATLDLFAAPLQAMLAEVADLYGIMPTLAFVLRSDEVAYAEVRVADVPAEKPAERRERLLAALSETAPEADAARVVFLPESGEGDDVRALALVPVTPDSVTASLTHLRDQLRTPTAARLLDAEASLYVGLARLLPETSDAGLEFAPPGSFGDGADEAREAGAGPLDLAGLGIAPADDGATVIDPFDLPPLPPLAPSVPAAPGPDGDAFDPFAAPAAPPFAPFAPLPTDDTSVPLAPFAAAADLPPVEPVEMPAWTPPSGPVADGVTLVLRVGHADTLALFLRDGEPVHVATLASLTSDDPPETLCSRVLLVQDEHGLGDVTRLLLLAERDEADLLVVFGLFFPDAVVASLRSVLPGSLAHAAADADDTRIVGALAVALRLAGTPAQQAVFPAVNLLPRALTRTRVRPRVEWSLVALCVLLFVTTLGFTARYVFLERRIDEARDDLRAADLATADASVVRLQTHLDSLGAVQTQREHALHVLDSLLKGSDRWSRTLETVARGAASVPGIWVENWAHAGQTVTLTGTATSRDRIVQIAEVTGGNLQSMTFNEIRDFPVYTFELALDLPTDLPEAARYLRESALAQQGPTVRAASAASNAAQPSGPAAAPPVATAPAPGAAPALASAALPR